MEELLDARPLFLQFSRVRLHPFRRFFYIVLKLSNIPIYLSLPCHDLPYLLKIVDEELHAVVPLGSSRRPRFVSFFFQHAVEFEMADLAVHGDEAFVEIVPDCFDL